MCGKVFSFNYTFNCLTKLLIKVLNGTKLEFKSLSFDPFVVKNTLNHANDLDINFFHKTFSSFETRYLLPHEISSQFNNFSGNFISVFILT